MNKLIWINEVDLNKEERFIEKLKPEIEFLNIWSFGDFYKKPIMWDNNNIVINWNFYENKAEFFVTEKYIKWFCNYYFYLIYYGEWGQLKEKHIIFMEIESEKLKKKEKKPIKTKEVFKFIKKNKRIKMSIYFEPTIQEDPEKEYYKENNNLWISSIGGLYDVIDPSWEGFELCNLDEWIFLEKKEILDKKCGDIIEIAKESAKTAKEMKINNKKWELFKYSYN